MWLLCMFLAEKASSKDFLMRDCRPQLECPASAVTTNHIYHHQRYSLPGYLQYVQNEEVIHHTGGSRDRAYFVKNSIGAIFKVL